MEREPRGGKHRAGYSDARDRIHGRRPTPPSRDADGRRRPSDDEADDAETAEARSAARCAKRRSCVTIALVLYYVMLTFVARPYLIPSESMEPTLHGCAGCVGRPHHGRQGHLPVHARRSPATSIVFKGPPNWNIGYKSIRSTNAAVRWVQNALSFVGFVPPDENDLVKRVIAVGGQTVECRADTGLTVDGKKLNEPFLDADDDDGRPSGLPVPRQ